MYSPELRSGSPMLIVDSVPMISDLDILELLLWANCQCNNSR